MIWCVATACGFMLGLLYFGGLWLSVRRAVRTGLRTGQLVGGRAVRLALATLVLATLTVHTGAHVIGALAGFWLARWCVLRCLGGVGDERR